MSASAHWILAPTKPQAFLFPPNISDSHLPFYCPKFFFPSISHFSIFPCHQMFPCSIISYHFSMIWGSRASTRRPTTTVVSSTNFTLSLPFDFNHIFSNLKELLPLLSHCNQAIYDIVVFGVTSNSTWEDVPPI